MVHILPYLASYLPGKLCMHAGGVLGSMTQQVPFRGVAEKQQVAFGLLEMLRNSSHSTPTQCCHHLAWCAFRIDYLSAMQQHSTDLAICLYVTCRQLRRCYLSNATMSLYLSKLAPCWDNCSVSPNT